MSDDRKIVQLRPNFAAGATLQRTVYADKGFNPSQRAKKIRFTRMNPRINEMSVDVRIPADLIPPDTATVRVTVEWVRP